MGIVAGLGLVGGSLAAVFALRKVRGSSTPYDLPLTAAFLKVPTGALTAVVGMLLLGGGFVPGLSALDSQRQILACDLLLGYGQQLATQLVDKQAQIVLNAVPSRDPQAPPQTPTASTQQGAPPATPDSSANGATPTGVPATVGSTARRGVGIVLEHHARARTCLGLVRVPRSLPRRSCSSGPVATDQPE